MNSELYDLTQVFPKDAKYTECEDCSGKGYDYQAEVDGSTTAEKCDRCNGTGELEIEQD